MKPLVLVIVGPTASGKTRLSIDLAERFHGEIISADSMQIYRKMDVGTAKPTLAERRGIPHHMIDIIEPTMEYTIKQYLQDADRCVQDVLARNKLPILVGGTGLYVSSFLNNLTLSEEPFDAEYHESLERDYDEHGGEHMLDRLRKIDPTLAQKLFPKDRKRILRGLEAYHNTGKTRTELDRIAMQTESPYRFLVFGLTAADRAFLYGRINRRVEIMIADGLEEEVRELSLDSCSRTARQAIGYRQFEEYFDGTATLEETVLRIQQESRNYAKRQLTWFRRDPRIEWFEIDRLDYDNILNFCSERIAKQNEM